MRLHRGHDHARAAARGSARRSCPRGRSGSRRDRRPPRARRPGRSSRRSRRAPRRSGGAAPPAPARPRPPAGVSAYASASTHLDLAAREAVAVGQVTGLERRRPRSGSSPRRASRRASGPAARSAGRPSPRPSTCRSASPPTIAQSRSGSASDIARPGTVTPRKPSRTSRSSTATPCLRANPSAALLAQLLGRPLHPPVRLALGHVVDEQREPPRPDEDACPPPARGATARAAVPRPHGTPRQGAPRSRSQAAGSARVSTIELGDGAGEVAHPADVRGALGHGDRPARVEQVEGVRALEHLVVGRERQRSLDERAALGLVLVEAAHEHVDGRLLEVVDRPLALVLAVDVAPGHARAPTRARTPSACPAGTWRAARART